MSAINNWHSPSEPYEFLRIESDNNASVDSTYAQTIVAAGTYNTFNGYTFYIPSGTGRFTFYHGTDATVNSTKLMTVHVTAGPNSDTVMIPPGLKCHNGLHLKVEAGTFSHLGVFYR